MSLPLTAYFTQTQVNMVTGNSQSASGGTHHPENIGTELLFCGTMAELDFWKRELKLGYLDIERGKH